MGVTEDKIKDLKAREARLLKMGGEKAVGEQKKKGKLTAGSVWICSSTKALPRTGHVRYPSLLQFRHGESGYPSDGVITVTA